jgi:hypothetical protein
MGGMQAPRNFLRGFQNGFYFNAVFTDIVDAPNAHSWNRTNAPITSVNLETANRVTIVCAPPRINLVRSIHIPEVKGMKFLPVNGDHGN